MISQQQPSALSDEKIIECLATEVMGWKKHSYTWKYIEDGKVQSCKSCGSQEHTGHNYKWLLDREEIERSGWNPLTDWNHWRQVEEKVIETEWAWSQLVDYFRRWGGGWIGYMKADLPTRCRSLIAALDSLHD